MPGIELRLLGGASLQEADGLPLSSRASHRHRIALLARLALAAPGGVSRDKLVGLLWPERDESSARRLLRAALHELRQTLGPEALPGQGNDVRLDGRRVLVDVHRFESALSVGDFAVAVAQYRGPLLDGFFLDSAEEFDLWMSAERLRLAKRYEEALETLARSAESRGDAAEAGRWWRLLLGERPSDGRVALHVVNAMAAAGDPAGAIMQAAAHAKLLREEFGAKPDAALVDRVRKLRATMGTATADEAPFGAELPSVPPIASTAGQPRPADQQANAGPATGAESGDQSRAASAAVPTSQTQSLPEPVSPPEAATASSIAQAESPAVGNVQAVETDSARLALRIPPEPKARSNRKRLVWLGGIVVTVIAAGSLAVLNPTLAARSGWSDAGAQSAGAPTVMAVAPFEVVAGAAPELRDGLASLITANLDQVPELQMVPAATVATRQRESSVAGAQSTDALLRTLRADALLTGVIAAAGDGIAVTAKLTDREGVVRARADVRGAASDLATVVDRVSLELLRDLWGRRFRVPQPRIASVGTSSSTALRAFVRGEAFLRAAQWDSATEALTAAVEIDSTFALAHLRLSEPYGWRFGMASAPSNRALATAHRFREKLPPRERLLLDVRRLHETGNLAALDSAGALADRYPTDAEAQYVRADVRFHAREAAGLRMTNLATIAFDTAMLVDSMAPRVFAHPLSLALEIGDSARLERVTAQLAAMSKADGVTSQSLLPDYALLRRVRFAPQLEAAEALRARLRRAPTPRDAELLNLLTALEHNVLASPEPNAKLLFEAYTLVRPSNADAGSWVEGRRVGILMGLGRMNEARSYIARAWERSPNTASIFALTPVVFGFAPPGWLAEHERWLNASPDARGTAQPRRRVDYWRALFALAASNAPAARAALQAVTAARVVGTPDDTSGRGFGGAVTAAGGWLRVLEGDTAQGMREVERGLRDVGYEGDGLLLSRPTRIWWTRLLASIPTRRAEALDRIDGELVRQEGYRLAWWRLERARLLAARGDAAAADRERARFDAMLRGADAEVRAAALRLR